MHVLGGNSIWNELMPSKWNTSIDKSDWSSAKKISDSKFQIIRFGIRAVSEEVSELFSKTRGGIRADSQARSRKPLPKALEKKGLNYFVIIINFMRVFFFFLISIYIYKP